jgi:hypothetical protein
MRNIIKEISLLFKTFHWGEDFDYEIL